MFDYFEAVVNAFINQDVYHNIFKLSKALPDFSLPPQVQQTDRASKPLESVAHFQLSCQALPTPPFSHHLLIA